MHNNNQQGQHQSNETVDSLSCTYIYGISDDGYCLARGQLTNATIIQMRRLSRKYRKKRSKKLLEAKSPAIGGFEIMMQIAGNPVVIEQYTQHVLKAWSSYLTYTRTFGYIKRPLFLAGIHLILIGSYRDDGSMRIEMTAVPSPNLLTDEDLKEIAKEFEAVKKNISSIKNSKSS